MTEATEHIDEANANWRRNGSESDPAETMREIELDEFGRMLAWSEASSNLEATTQALQAQIDNGGGYTREKEASAEQMKQLTLAAEYMKKQSKLNPSSKAWKEEETDIIDRQLKLHIIDEAEHARHAEAIKMVHGIVQEQEQRISDIDANLENKRTAYPTQPEAVEEPVESVTPSEFFDEREKERQKLLGEVLRTAKGSARILTSVMPGVKLPFSDGYANVHSGGGMEFGDGATRGKSRLGETGMFLDVSNSPEALIFEPAMTPQYETVKKTVRSGGLFGGTKQVEERVQTGEIPEMVVNPVTGQEEPGVTVRYQFNSNGYNYDYENQRSKGYPPYTAPDSNRAGNYLLMEVTLPESVAGRLKQDAVHDPNAIRQLARSLLTENGATEVSVKTPPYTELPADWTIAIADMSTIDGKTHQITSQQTVKL